MNFRYSYGVIINRNDNGNCNVITPTGYSEAFGQTYVLHTINEFDPNNPAHPVTTILIV